MTPPSATVRLALRERLDERWDELERMVLERVCAIADPGAVSYPSYLASLRAAVPAAIEFGLDAIERGEDRVGPPSAVVVAQGRVAALSGVPLHTVVRRLFAGYALLGDFLIDAAEAAELQAAEWKPPNHAHTASFDRLLAAVIGEYEKEEPVQVRSVEQRRATMVRRLIAGELLEAPDLPYELAGTHIGIVGAGAGLVEILQRLARELDLRLLLVNPEEETVWAWLGVPEALDVAQLEQTLKSCLPPRTALALGEPGNGFEGWRRTYRQAAAAFPVASSSEPVVRYAEVAILAAAMRDELLARSLSEIYLAPLDGYGGSDTVLKETLRAYFKCHRMVSSTSAALNVSRQTVDRRLKAIEQRLDRSIGMYALELDLALRVEAVRSFA